jgi:hypothetical protein
MKILNKSKYDGYVFTCPNCKLEVELENEDLNRLIYKTYSGWYEANMPRDNHEEVFIKCNCNSLIPIETAQYIGVGIKEISICGRKRS